RPRPRLEDVDRELVVELACRDAVAGGGDPLGLVGVEEPELGVDTRGRGLDPAEPTRDVHRDRLSGDREVPDRLRRLAAPQLGPLRRPRHVVACTPPVSSSSSHVRSFTRGRPSGSPALRSRASIARQPSSSTYRVPFSSRSRARSPPCEDSRPARASSSSRSTVSVASFLFVPITPLGPRLIHPAT